MTKRYFNETPGLPGKERFDFSGIFKDLKKDDMIILGIILILIGDGCEDKELLLMLGFLFVSDKIDIAEKLLPSD